MKKLSLLLGTLGGAMAGYVFSNTKLREELSTAKDAEAAGKILAKHLQKDGKQIGKEVKQFVDSDVVQGNVKKAKQYANTTAKKWKGDLQSMIKEGKESAKSMTVKARSKSKSAVKKGAAKAKKAADNA